MIWPKGDIAGLTTGSRVMGSTQPGKGLPLSSKFPPQRCLYLSYLLIADHLQHHDKGFEDFGCCLIYGWLEKLLLQSDIYAPLLKWCVKCIDLFCLITIWIFLRKREVCHIRRDNYMRQGQSEGIITSFRYAFWIFQCLVIGIRKAGNKESWEW